MMRINTITTQADRSGRHTVRFDDGTSMRLYRQTVEDFGLSTGMEFTEDEFLALKTAAGAMSAKMRAVRIVAATSVSKNDLQQRLVRKGEDPQQAQDAVTWMENLQLLDDSKVAAQVVSKCIHKGYGIGRAKQALFEKRVPKEYWDKALENYPVQTDAIVSFLRTRLGSNWDNRDLHKAIDALLRRGHSYSEIRIGLVQLSLEAEDFRED